MKRLRCMLASLALLAATAASAAGFLEREVSFSEAEIQAALDKGQPPRFSYGKMLSLAMNEAPRISLDQPDGRAGLRTAVDVELQGQPPIRVDIAGRTGIRYDEQEKSFYLDKPVIDSVSSPTLAREAAPAVRQAVSRLLDSLFRSRPVYTLREDGNLKEKTARWLLKSVRIEPGRVVAVLSPL